MADPDQVNQFLVMLGSCADGARLAHARLAVELEDGTEVEGVPSVSPIDESERQLDSSGTGRVLILDGVPVQAAEVRSYRVTKPT